MTSTSFNVGLTSGTRNSSKVLKPPGGGSSDIFGAVEQTEPRKGRAQVQQQSSLFMSHDEATPVKTKSGNDTESHVKLSDQKSSRFSSAAKNKDKFKSNIVFGTDDSPFPTPKKNVETVDVGVAGLPDIGIDSQNGSNRVMHVHDDGMLDILQLDRTDRCQFSPIGGYQRNAFSKTKSNTMQHTLGGPPIGFILEFDLNTPTGRDGNAVTGNGYHKPEMTHSEPQPQQLMENGSGPPPSHSAAAPAQSAAAARPRVPPGGFSKGLW